MLEQFKITRDRLSLDEVYHLAEDPGNGAIALMSGMVRNQTEGKPVIALDYQAYEPMALQIFQQIANRIAQTYPTVNRVVIHHRLGYLEIGEVSVIIAVGSPHRAEAFAACQYAIDALKEDAPIWKHECWADGTQSWVKPSVDFLQRSGKRQ